MSDVHCGRVFHVAGRRAVSDAALPLVSIPDGALIVDDDGQIVHCGERNFVPTEFDDAVVHGHRPGFFLPGVVDTHVHFPQTLAGDFPADPLGTPALDASMTHGVRSSDPELTSAQTLFALLIAAVYLPDRNVTAS